MADKFFSNHPHLKGTVFYLCFIISKKYNSFYLGFIFGIPTFPPCGIHQTNQKSLSRVDVNVGAVSVIAPTIFKGNLNNA